MGNISYLMTKFTAIAALIAVASAAAKTAPVANTTATAAKVAPAANKTAAAPAKPVETPAEIAADKVAAAKAAAAKKAAAARDAAEEKVYAAAGANLKSNTAALAA